MHVLVVFFLSFFFLRNEIINSSLSIFLPNNVACVCVCVCDKKSRMLSKWKE